jgi:Holliday junction resolvase
VPKKIPFKTYRYHLVPVKSDQLSVFGDKLSIDELKEKKNDLFRDIILNSKSLQGRSSQLPIALDYSDQDIFVLKLAVDRKTVLYKNFKPVDVENQPFIYVLINNDDQIQKILIEDNKAAFYNTSAAKNILEKAFSTQLAFFDLTIHIEPVVDEDTFWDFIKKHERSIERLDFEIVKPNLANISKSLKAPLKQLVDITNSHKTTIKLKAPTNGVLENINVKNDQLNSLVEYSNEGGGDGIKMKLKGVKKTVTTKNMIKETYINSVELETMNQQKLLDGIATLFN